jgi:hypothetical protein
MKSSSLLRQVTASALIMGMLIATPATTPYLSRLLSVESVSAATFSVTVEQTAGQVDPAPVGAPILYTVTFATPIDVATFTVLDLDFSASTATGITVNSITEIAPSDGTTFSVSVSASTAGDVVMQVRAGVSNTAILGYRSNSTSYHHRLSWEYLYSEYVLKQRLQNHSS